MIKGVDYIYCVSDCYLRALVAESKPYSFEVKACCSLEEGLNQLKYLNLSEIRGFVILIEEITNDDKYFYNLVDLINSINLIGSGQPVVLAICNSDGYQSLDGYLETDNISLFLVDDIDFMTDIVIRRDIYGTIIKETSSPYVSKSKAKNVYDGQEEFSSSNVKPLFRENIQRLVEPVVVAPNINRAIENDDVLLSISEDDDIPYFLRLEQINKAYNVVKDTSEMFKTLLTKVTDRYEKTIYISIYNLIKEGKL